MKSGSKKKWIAAAALVSVVACSTQIANAAEAALKAIVVHAKLIADDKEVKLDKDAVVINGSLYVPVKAMGDALGQQASWDNTTKTLTLKAYPFVKAKYTWNNAPSLGSNIKEGGFSGLLHMPGDPDNVFYTLADRGPNGQITIDKSVNRTFPVQSYEPRFYKIELVGDQVNVLATTKLTLPAGKTGLVSKNQYLTGLSNIAADEKSYDNTGKTLLPLDPDGLDLEGITYSPSDDTFWLSDEYRPSLIHIKRDGTEIARYVPFGDKALLKDAQTPIIEAIPAIYAKRIANRGFEGVTISPDGKFLYASIQSPMAVPDQATGEASRNLRILKMDLKAQQIVGEYVYVAEDAKSFVKVNQKDVVISDLSAISSDVLLVDERDKNEGAAAQIKRVYKIDLSKATNILGKDISNTVEGATADQFKAANITTAPKELVVDLTKLGYPFEKFEGLTVVNKNRIAIANDNDFGVTEYDANGVLKIVDKPTQVWEIEVKDLW
ncbi:esterase-like activity of phytase family protein [Paenibacillus sp. R14(2021)]|uniref:esterase-like activity of phytase family protein n=1 Tax=Paenibacillus sp. R14(2021) TaxID=2859228 RepID=UPI001C615819|nr:esterase-like activity of phytase family protein [Paenibacillus sp. R14(2021)]